jgi:hypothetical protein
MSINGHRLSSAGLKQQRSGEETALFWILTTCTKICQKSLNLKNNFHKGLLLLYLALSAKWQDSNENEQRNFKLFLPNLIFSAASLSSLMKLATVFCSLANLSPKNVLKKLEFTCTVYKVRDTDNSNAVLERFWAILSTLRFYENRF